MGRPSKYSDEFRWDAVTLVRSTGRTVESVAVELGVNRETLRTWVRRSEQADTASGGLGADERAELARLRKAEKEWQLEREILRRAAQYFAKEMK